MSSDAKTFRWKLSNVLCAAICLNVILLCVATPILWHLDQPETGWVLGQGSSALLI